MAKTTTYQTATHNGHTFEWTSTEYVSPTGGNHTRDGYKLDGKRVSFGKFYDALAAAKAEEEADKASSEYRFTATTLEQKAFQEAGVYSRIPTANELAEYRRRYDCC